MKARVTYAVELALDRKTPIATDYIDYDFPRNFERLCRDVNILFGDVIDSDDIISIELIPA